MADLDTSQIPSEGGAGDHIELPSLSSFPSESSVVSQNETLLTSIPLPSARAPYILRGFHGRIKVTSGTICFLVPTNRIGGGLSKSIDEVNQPRDIEQGMVGL